MPAPDEFTGERFLPDCTGEIWAEHWHRYLFAASLVAGRDVLDAACGEGYGSAWLARHAKSVTGLDIDGDTVEIARVKYQAPGLRFEAGSVTDIPLPDASFDCVVSFETLEHLAEQEEMLAEMRRVLRPDGLLVISTPNKVEYSEKRDFRNEFHVRELYENEFRELLARHFGAQRWYGQRLLFNSAIWPLAQSGADAAAMKAQWITVAEGDQTVPPPMYFVAIAARTEKMLPRVSSATLLADPADAIYREYESTVSRSRTLEQLVSERERIVIERDRQIALHDQNARDLEAVIAERESQLAAQAARAATMERLIAERERVIVERDAQLRSVNGIIGERERLIAERDELLGASNARIAEAERLLGVREALITERDGQLAATNERLAAAEGLLADRERIIVERDAQLQASARRQQTLEGLLLERERIIVERDAQIDAINARLATAEALIGDRERIIVERDAQLQATNERMALAERVIAERERDIAGRDEAMRRATAAFDLRIGELQFALARMVAERDALNRSNLALRTEVVRRASWRWWLALPIHRIRGTVPTSIDADGNAE